MIKTPVSLQDLRRRIYRKAKAETAWRFWGLYVHVCKLETLREAYLLAKQNNGAPGIDGVTFEAIEAERLEAFLQQLRDELPAHTIVRCGYDGRRYPKSGGKASASWGFPPFATAWSRARSSSFWSPSSRLISNRGRLATGRSGQRMTR